MHRKRAILIPVSIFVVLAALLHAIWFLADEGRQNAVRVQTNITAEQVAIRLRDYLRFRLELVAQIRREWAQGQITTQEQFINRAQTTQEQFSGFQAINWIDEQGIIRWVVPRGPNLQAENRDLHRHPDAGQYFVRAEQTGTDQITPPIQLLQSGLGIATYFPITMDGRRVGYINGVFRISEMIQDCLKGKILAGYGLRIKDKGQTVFDNTSNHITDLTPQATQHIPLSDRTWILTLAPSAEVWRNRSTGLDRLLLSLGILLALGLSWVSRLYLLKQTDLAKNERDMRRLIDAMPDQLFLFDRTGKLVDFRIPEPQRLCPTPQDLRDRRIDDLLAPGQVTSARKAMQRALADQEAQTYEYQLEVDGVNRHYEARLVPRDDDRILAIVRDVTEKREAERALIVSENKYRTLFEESQDVIFLTTPDGILTDINPAGVELLGFDNRDAMLGMDVPNTVFFDPRDAKPLWNALRLQGVVRNKEITLKRQDGIQIHALISISTERKDTGEIIALRSTLRDMTARKRLEQQLFQAQKMESMGTLAGGIAHDFNNILSGILGYASLLKARMEPGSPSHHHAETIEKSALRAAELTAQLLAFSRGGLANIRPLNLNAVISDTLRIISRTFDKSIEIVTDLDPQLANINADESQIQQVILNICVNSRDAMPNGGRLVIETHNEHLSVESQEEHTDITPGEYARMSISDTGIGIQPGIRERIFEPFFTTKGPGQGTGLGLSVVFGVIRNHKGFIDVESSDTGTTFNVFLPATQGETDFVEEPTESPQTGEELVMVVDDDDTVRNLAEEILNGHGYRTIAAEDGQRAVEIFRSMKDEISVVVLDLLMPHMSGEETLAHLSALKSDVKVLLCSGFGQNKSVERLIQSRPCHFLQKPYRPNELLGMVRDMLESRGPQPTHDAPHGPSRLD